MITSMWPPTKRQQGWGGDVRIVLEDDHRPGARIRDSPSGYRLATPYRLSSAYRFMTKKLLRPRSRRVSSALTVQQLSQFRCWKFGGAPDGSRTEPSDEELLTSKPHPGSFRAAIAHFIISGHFVGILPTSASPDTVPRFRWTSPSVIFSLFVLSAIVARIWVYSYSVYTGYMSLFDTIVSTRVGFHVISSLEFVLYIRLAARWRLFVLCFLRVEHRHDAGLDAGLDARRPPRVQIVSALLISFAVGEIVLQETTTALPRPLADYESLDAIFMAHYHSIYNNVAQAFSYSPAALFFAEFTTSATNLMLNYNDLFLILVSILIVRRVKILRDRIARDAPRKKDETYWKSARESFNDLSQLTREVDKYLSAHVFLSCLNNFFSICIQLQHTVSPTSLSKGLPRKLYFFFSFAFVMCRSAAVVLGAARIPEESKELRRQLYSVPSVEYSEEVQRFLDQVHTDDINFTGLGLFSITRSFILTMLGTIATYEILLVQMYRIS